MELPRLSRDKKKLDPILAKYKAKIIPVNGLYLVSNRVHMGGFTEIDIVKDLFNAVYEMIHIEKQLPPIVDPQKDGDGQIIVDQRSKSDQNLAPFAGNNKNIAQKKGRTSKISM